MKKYPNFLKFIINDFLSHAQLKRLFLYIAEHKMASYKQYKGNKKMYNCLYGFLRETKFTNKQINKLFDVCMDPLVHNNTRRGCGGLLTKREETGIDKLIKIQQLYINKLLDKPTAHFNEYNILFNIYKRSTTEMKLNTYLWHKEIYNKIPDKGRFKNDRKVKLDWIDYTDLKYELSEIEVEVDNDELREKILKFIKYESEL